MKIALVHDYLTQYGGAERVLKVFTEIFPYAPIYTLVYNEKATFGVFKDKIIRTSFLQKIPLAKAYYRAFAFLMPLAVEQFDLSKYDIVLSDSSSFSKGIVTKPKTKHICYCHTPMRFAWDGSQKYIEEFYFPKFSKKIIAVLMNYVRLWDGLAADRTDVYIANSKFIAERIKKYYNKKSTVIYPPVKTAFFNPFLPSAEYFLMVGRLLPYKRFDIAVQAFNELKLPLKIIGDGPEKKRLMREAKSNIEFLGNLGDKEIKEYYSNCRAFIFPQEEDFGITAVEAMSCGKPVIAYQGGGALETIENGKTGLFFMQQNKSSLIETVRNFKNHQFDSEYIRNYSLKFSEERFKREILEFIEKECNM